MTSLILVCDISHSNEVVFLRVFFFFIQLREWQWRVSMRGCISYRQAGIAIKGVAWYKGIMTCFSRKNVCEKNMSVNSRQARTLGHRQPKYRQIHKAERKMCYLYNPVHRFLTSRLVSDNAKSSIILHKDVLGRLSFDF